MLFDPKWADAKSKTPSMEGLITWLETQNPDEKYNYYDCHGACLVELYLNAIGLHWRGLDGPGFELFTTEIMKPLRDVSVGYPYTFGAALERAKAWTA